MNQNCRTINFRKHYILYSIFKSINMITRKSGIPSYFKETSNLKPIDKLIETVFETITEEDKIIACKFPLSENNLKQLCRINKCVVRVDYANLLTGIEKKILAQQPLLINDPKKLQAKVYRWHKNHVRASNKYCERSLQDLNQEKENFWRQHKLNNIISLGIHPKILVTTFERYGNFEEAIELLKNLDIMNGPELSLVKIQINDSESDESIITVINTQSQEVNTEYLMGPEPKDSSLTNFEIYFDSEEVVESQLPSYDQFHGQNLVTSTQKN